MDVTKYLSIVAEIAKTSINRLIQSKRPLLPSEYENMFFNVASELGHDPKVLLSYDSIFSVFEKSVGYMRACNESIEDSLNEAMSSSDLKVVKECVEKARNELIRQRRQFEKLESLAKVDRLTGLKNRLSFEEEIKIFFNRFKDKEATVVIADLDDFKKINDTYGHLVGDQVLITFANVLIRYVGINAFGIYRYGGEEFVILMSESMESSESILKTIWRHLNSVCFMSRDYGCKLKVTASFGVSQLSNLDQSPHDALSRADKALYYVKNNGKNQIASYEGISKY